MLLMPPQVVCSSAIVQSIPIVIWVTSPQVPYCRLGDAAVQVASRNVG
jgi:hypothetical protein